MDIGMVTASTDFDFAANEIADWVLTCDYKRYPDDKESAHDTFEIFERLEVRTKQGDLIATNFDDAVLAIGRRVMLLLADHCDEEASTKELNIERAYA
jgi:hypothetical protein